MLRAHEFTYISLHYHYKLCLVNFINTSLVIMRNSHGVLIMYIYNIRVFDFLNFISVFLHSERSLIEKNIKPL